MTTHLTFYFQRLFSATAENSSEAFPQVTNPGEEPIFSQFTAENKLIVIKKLLLQHFLFLRSAVPFGEYATRVELDYVGILNLR